MVSRKWFYSYRILTARLRESVATPASRRAGVATRSAAPQPRQISINDEPTEGEPSKSALLLTAGGKM